MHRFVLRKPSLINEISQANNNDTPESVNMNIKYVFLATNVKGQNEIIQACEVLKLKFYRNSSTKLPRLQCGSQSKLFCMRSYNVTSVFCIKFILSNFEFKISTQTGKEIFDLNVKINGIDIRLQRHLQFIYVIKNTPKYNINLLKMWQLSMFKFYSLRCTFIQFRLFFCDSSSA